MIELPLMKEVIRTVRDGDSVFDVIMTSGRGGLMFAQLMAYGLGIKTVHVVNNSRGLYPRIQANQRVLIVDDINDSGATIMKMIKEVEAKGIRHIEVAVIYERYNSMFKAEYIGEMIDNDEWHTFSWDKKEFYDED